MYIIYSNDILFYISISLREKVVCVSLCECVCAERERENREDKYSGFDYLYIPTHTTAFHLLIYYFGLYYSK